MPIHDRFVPEQWEESSDASSLNHLRHVSDVSTPAEVCEVLRRRRALQARQDLGRSVPADVFVFFPGEPANPSATKMGGVPYRPSHLGWPCAMYGESVGESSPAKHWRELLREMKEDDYDFEGSVEAPTASDMKRFTSEYWPLHFLGQFNFADSRDLAGDLPGDVLLLFGSFDGHDLLSYWEWHSLDLGDRMTEADVPPLVPEYPSDKELPCHGQILRTCDFVDFDYDNLNLEGLDFGDRREIERLFFWEATRIGGAPFCCQRPTDWTPGRFLCALSGLHSSDSTIYIHLDAEGRLHWDDQCT